MFKTRFISLLVLLAAVATGAVAQEPGLPVVNGKFSVSSTKKVYFSKGNLQYDGTNWKFAASQWEVLGANGTGANGTATKYPMDLFTWGNIDSPTYNGTTYYTVNANLSGITDWGSRMGSGWFTLSSAEWTYLFNTRTVNGGKGSGKSYTLGQSVNGKPGVVIYPDNYIGGVYSGSDWATFESAGCVFLPIAGLRGGANVNYVGARGCYWSSTNNNTNHAFYVYFNTGEVQQQINSNRGYGLSVRLVHYDEVTLTDGQAITALNTHAGKEIWVSYTRSFTEGTASTVCLPFAYKKKEGDGSFYAFTNIEKVGNEYVATMTEPASTTLTANTPYLYMPNATGSVDFSGAYTIPADLTAGSTTSNGWTFKGTYEAITWTVAPTGTYGFSAQDVNEQGISQGQFVKAGEYVRIQPMRCYLENASFAGARGMKREAEPLPETIKVRLVSANGEVTGIGSLLTKTGEVTLDGGAWYSLDGRRTEGKPTAKGVYVNNGKKVIIK